MPSRVPPSDDMNQLSDQRSGKDRRQKTKQRFDDEDDQDTGDTGDAGRRRDKKDRRGGRTHRSLQNDD